MISKFDSVDSIVSYLQEFVPTPASYVVDPTLTASRIIKAKKQQKEKQAINIPPPSQTDGDIQILPKGRVRYGPVTVNPRKQPSKTLFTGRRSKYELLLGDEEEKRRDRRERNRVAATKCREKRENVLHDLDNELHKEVKKSEDLVQLVSELQQRKLDLETIMNNHLNECLLMNNTPPMIFGDAGFLSSIIEAPPLPLPNHPQAINTYSEEEEMSLFLNSNIPLLTNTAYNNDPLEISEEQLVLPMTNSSIDRLVNALHTPTVSMDSLPTHSKLFNSAVNSSCAKQHSNSSEDDSIPPKCTNQCVF